MKKFIACFLAVLLLCLSLPVVTVTALTTDTSAFPEPDEGFWSTYRDPGEYGLPDGEPYNPTVGFRYTDEGFTTIANQDQWKNITPKFTIQSSEPVDIRNGFYMQFRVDEFSYKGDQGNADEWISLSISDRPLIKHGAMDHGNNWISLIRGNGDGRGDLQSFITRENTDEQVGSFNHLGSNAIEIPMNRNGQEIYDLEIIHNGSNDYDIRICGVSVEGLWDISSTISQYENCYIGLTFYSGVKDGVAGCTILKQGTDKENAMTPTGTASKEPEENLFILGDMIDSSTVPDGQPALLFDGSMSTFNGMPSSAGCELTLNKNNTWHVSSTSNIPYFMWKIKNDLSYEASDFPVFTMMLKNFAGDSCGAYYSAGDMVSITELTRTDMDIWDEDTSRWYEVGNDEYTFVTVTINDFWSGRIHAIRPHFYISDPSDPYYANFDVCFMAFFRSTEDAFAYADAYMSDGESTKPPVDQETRPPVDPDTFPSNRYGTVGSFVSGGREDFEPVGYVGMDWVPYADESITFDGDMSDWANFSQSEIRPNNMVSWVGNEKVDDGYGTYVDAHMPKGFGIKTSYLADSRYLYIGLQVTDPDAATINSGNPENYVSGDAIQLQIDIGGKYGNILRNDPDMADIVSRYSAAFYSFGYAGDGQAITVVRQNTDTRDSTLTVENSGVEGYTGKTADGWCAELRIPWEELYLDYMDIAWLDEETVDKLYVGEDLPLTVDMALCYLNTDEYTGSSVNWAAMTHNGSTDPHITSSGEPVLAWDVYDIGTTLYMEPEEGMSFDTKYIVVGNDPETEPETETEPDIDPPAKPDALPDDRNGVVGAFVVGDREDFTPVGDVKMDWVPDADKQITFDGNVSDWSSFSTSEIRPDNMVSWVGNEKIDNGNGSYVDAGMPEGFKIKTSYLADSKYLYIALQVTDPDVVLVDPINPESYFGGDAIQMQIDIGGKFGDTLRGGAGLLSPWAYGGYSSAFYSFGYAGDGAPLTIVRQNTFSRDMTLTVENSGVEGYSGKTIDGWCAELRIPWEELWLDYQDKALLYVDEFEKIYVGGDKKLPLTVDMAMDYLNTDGHTGAGITWAAIAHNGTTDPHITYTGEPVVGWDIYDIGMTLYLTPEEGMTFDTDYIIADIKPDTEPETETETDPVPETEPITRKILVKSVQTATVDGESVVYVTAEDGKVYRGTLSDDESLILIKEGQTLSVTYVGSKLDGIYDILSWKKLSDGTPAETQTEPETEPVIEPVTDSVTESDSDPAYETEPKPSEPEPATPSVLGGFNCFSSIDAIGTPMALLLMGAALLLCRRKKE